jgi:sec-independent protein translocase protein TatC
MALRLSTTGSEPDNPDENKAELTEHLAELRTRLIRSCLYCLIGMVIMYVLFKPIYDVLSAPITNALSHDTKAHLPPGVQGAFVVTNFAEPFLLKLQISVVGGLIIAIPFVALELWGFIAPGLTRNERRAVRMVAPFSILLFLLGVGIAFLVMPMAIRWFLSYLADIPGAVLFQNPLTYIVFTVKMMLAFGLVFQLPVVLMFLGKAGILSSAMMVKYWRQITVGLFTAAMVVAPSNDPGTMLALAIPLTILFLASIWLVRLVEPKE